MTVSLAVPANKVEAFLAEHKLRLAKVDTISVSSPEPVWDLSIEDPTNPLAHSYTVNGIVTHNSSSPDYIENIMKGHKIKMPIAEVFGIRDPKSGHWTIKPRVRYYSETVAEKFFDYLAKLERWLPDKRKIGDTWYFIFDDTKVNRARVKDFDPAYLKKTGKLRIPAPDGNLQALILVDSYPAMLPEKQDVDDPNSAIAVQARMFSDQLKRVKGRMRAKRIAVIGVNQLRMVPMAMYGPSESEPGGVALKLFSDVRLRMASRANPKPGAKGQLEEEPAVLGEGKDTYRYVNVRAIKNKLSVPNLETWLRIWVTDHTGVARGFDPVWDTFTYLKDTGQVKGTWKKMKLQLSKPVKNQAEVQLESKVINWLTFKNWVLGNKEAITESCKAAGFKQVLSLRNYCKKQMETDAGLDLYFIEKKRRSMAKKDEVDE